MPFLRPFDTLLSVCSVGGLSGVIFGGVLCIRIMLAIDRGSVVGEKNDGLMLAKNMVGSENVETRALPRSRHDPRGRYLN